MEKPWPDDFPQDTSSLQSQYLSYLSIPEIKKNIDDARSLFASSTAIATEADHDEQAPEATASDS